jgi:tRNA (mo5U34)-methyltransferase
MTTQDELQAGVQALEPWFHQIDLGHGVKTKSRPAATEPIDHPSGTWEIIRRCLPDDLEGRSVLDAGCNAGFYAIEVKRRNAGRVLGIDSQRLHIRQARFVARVLGLHIEYERMSVYDLSVERVGKFDITLALGLIYHCKHLLLALERLFQVTADLLILESEVLFEAPSFDALAQAVALGRRLHPMAYVENEPSSLEAAYNWFIPGVEGLKAMLLDVGFSEVNVVSEAKGRAVIVCQRPHLDPDSLSMPRLVAAELTMVEGPHKCLQGTPIRFRISAANTGKSAWLDRRAAPDITGSVRLGVHLLDDSGQEIVHDYGGTSIPRGVAPGATLVMEVTLPAPSTPGKYQLEFDMVSEYLTWFEDAGATIPLVHRLEVE